MQNDSIQTKIYIFVMKQINVDLQMYNLSKLTRKDSVILAD